MEKQFSSDKVKSEFKKFHDLAASGGSIVEKIERDDLPFPFTHPVGIDRNAYAVKNKVDLSIKETKLDEIIHKLFELKLNYFVKYAEEPTHIFMSRYVYHNLMQLHGIERYCELPHMTGGNTLKLLGMTVIITVSSADNQVFLNSSSNMFLSD